jgi:hypothetical protein
MEVSEKTSSERAYCQPVVMDYEVRKPYLIEHCRSNLRWQLSAILLGLFQLRINHTQTQNATQKNLFFALNNNWQKLMVFVHQVRYEFLLQLPVFKFIYT